MTDEPKEVVNTATPMISRAGAEETSRNLAAEVEALEKELDEVRRAGLVALYPDTGGNLVAHATRELERAGLFDADADYGGMVANEVLDLMRVFAAGGHSGGSAALTIELFSRLARFDVLAPITSHPDEWMEVGNGMHQNRRKSSVFWRSGEETWYDLDDPKKEAHA